MTALNPTIDLERCLNSLRWFLDTFCYRLNKNVQKLIIVLARFVLTHCFITCPEVSANPFHQLIGTAMGTPFAVVYANIHLFFIETDIVYSFQSCTNLYSRFLDDGITFWEGSDEDFAVFSDAFNRFDPTSRFIWSICSKAAVMLDLSIKISIDKIPSRSTLSQAVPLHTCHSAHFMFCERLQRLSRLCYKARLLTHQIMMDGLGVANYCIPNSENAITVTNG